MDKYVFLRAGVEEHSFLIRLGRGLAAFIPIPELLHAALTETKLLSIWRMHGPNNDDSNEDGTKTPSRYKTQRTSHYTFASRVFCFCWFD